MTGELLHRILYLLIIAVLLGVVFTHTYYTLRWLWLERKEEKEYLKEMKERGLL